MSDRQFEVVCVVFSVAAIALLTGFRVILR